jgi:hypothetical protein
MKKILKKDYFWIILILFFSLLAARFLLRPGFYTFSDEPHIANLYQMIRAIKSGQIPPRWAPDVSFNFGHPLFNFYYLLPFYLGSFFHFFLGTSLIGSLKLVFLLSFPFSGVAFYFLMRKFFSQVASFSASILYIFAPYRAVDLYVRGAVGEMWGFVLMPLVALCFINLIERKNFYHLSLAGLSLAGLILAHNLTPLIFLPFLVVLILVLIWQRKDKTLSFIYSLVASVLGLALSAYYWLPAVLEKKYLQKGTPFHPLNHFPFIKQLIFPSWGYGASVWGPNDELSFQIGVINFLVVVLAVFSFFITRKVWGKKKIVFFLFSLFSFLFSVFMMNIRSWFIWKLLPIGEYIQFPWRFLMLTTFFSSLMVGFAEPLLNRKWQKILPLSLALLAIILTWGYFKPAKQVRVDDDYYLRRFFADRTILGKRDSFSKEYLSYSEDYLPLTIWTKERPRSLLPKVETDDVQALISFQEKTPTKLEIDFQNNRKTNLFINTYYFPGWKAWINGEAVKIDPAEPFGQMRMTVSAGEHKIRVEFKESFLRRVADIISLVGCIVFLAILVSPRLLLK